MSENWGLLPCPFCGHDPDAMTLYADGTETMRGIFCRNPECAVRPYLDAAIVGNNGPNAIYRWNERATQRGARQPDGRAP
jgi:hypothetical protein